MGRMSRLPGYEAEAEFYDFAWGEVRNDIDYYRNRLKGAHSILDCMCGTGRIAIALARAGFVVDGIDSSAEMLRRARLKCRLLPQPIRHRLHWKVGDITRADMGKGHDAAIIGLNSYGLILSQTSRIRALKRIHRALRPGGRLFLALDSVRSYRRIRDGVPFFVSARPTKPNGPLYAWIMAETGSRADPVRSTTLHLVLSRSGKPLKSCVTATTTAVIAPAKARSELSRAGFQLAKLFGDYDERPYSAVGDRFIIESEAR